jgi:hypothetical protein
MRPRLLIPAALLLILLAAYTGWWLYAARQVQSGIESWASDLRARAGFAAWRDLEVGGFPLWLRTQANGVEIRLPEGLDWRGAAVSASARPWNLQDVSLDLGGAQRLLVSSGREPAAEVLAAGGTGALRLGPGGRPVAGRLDLADAALGRPGEEAEHIRADRLVLEAARSTAGGAEVGAEPAASFSLSARDVALPPSLGTPLGPRIPSVLLEAGAAEPLPGRLDADAIAAWASAGGRVDVDRLEIEWGPLGLSAGGEVAFDPQLRPAGVLRAEVRGIDGTLDALAGEGVLRANDAAIAKAALGLLSRRAPDGVRVVEASVVMQNGWLHLGPIRLARLPSLDALLRPASPR